MPETTVRWVTGKQFVGRDSGGHSVVLSADDPPEGIKPSEMLLVALSTCSAVDVVHILAKKRISLRMLEVTATGEQDADPPWTFRRIHLLFKLSGKGLTAKAVEQAVRLSEEKYCSVAATVRGVAEVTTAYEIIPAEE